MIFTEGSAAKEQWYTALKQACGLASKQAVEEAYEQFCKQIKDARKQGNDYPQVNLVL